MFFINIFDLHFAGHRNIYQIVNKFLHELIGLIEDPFYFLYIYNKIMHVFKHWSQTHVFVNKSLFNILDQYIIFLLVVFYFHEIAIHSWIFYYFLFVWDLRSRLDLLERIYLISDTLLNISRDIDTTGIKLFRLGSIRLMIGNIFKARNSLAEGSGIIQFFFNIFHF